MDIVIYIENKQLLPEGKGGVGEWEKEVRDFKKNKLPVTKYMNQEYEMYSDWNRVSNNVTFLNGDRLFVVII